MQENDVTPFNSMEIKSDVDDNDVSYVRNLNKTLEFTARKSKVLHWNSSTLRAASYSLNSH